MSKCRAVLGTALAGDRSELGGRGDDRVRLCGVALAGLGRWFCLGVGRVAQTERSGVRRFWWERFVSYLLIFSSFILINRDLLNKLRTI